MKRNNALADRLDEVLLSGHWIANTNWQAQIQPLTWVQATHPIGTLNTVAALVYHVNYYLAGIIRVFQGGPLEIRDKYSFDMPPITSEEDWAQLREAFVTHAKTFINEVRHLPDSTLDEVFVMERYGTYLRNIEGVISHSYYHLGQLSLITKMLSEQHQPTKAS